jgi:hypothetical protein
MSSYIPIASQTLSSSTATVTFSSIPTSVGGKTLRDLVLVYNGTGSGFSFFGIRFNGSATTYAVTAAEGDGSTASSQATSSRDFGSLHINGTAVVRAVAVAQIFDFAQTNKHKTYLGRWNGDGSLVGMIAGVWGFNNAITSLSAIVSSGTFTAGSTFSLYGIEG